MEALLKVVSFMILVYGFFEVFDISLLKIVDDIVKILSKEKTDIKSVIKRQNRDEKQKGIRRVIEDAKSTLKIMGKEDRIKVVWLASIALFVVGTIFSLSISNFFLVPVLSIGLGLIPFWYVIYTSNYYRKQINEELETALSTITTSYIRSENIISAVEENIQYLNPPISEVFKFFLGQTKLITSNTKLAIENMKSKIQNDVFKEWCDALIACQDNRNLRTTLIPIVAKLSDTRIVSAELEGLLFEPMKEFITMTILLLANIPLIKVLNKDWYKILTKTVPGHAVLAVLILTIFISLGAVIRLIRPVEYKS
ncbi:type II secretion system F family protein [Xylanivirga thermophila]|uniref:type II secretion system F family protein n=1 Tax=Xylanivirga thermophila TaxID=2496273 RepID=UPI001FB1FFC7|nr:hypothetical protein [Xylanivirga thermophila]